MPWAVAFIGVSCFAAGIAVGDGRWVSGGWLIAIAVGMAWALRIRTISLINQAFERGAGYGKSSRFLVRKLGELEVHDVPKAAKERWLNGEPTDNG